MEGSERLFKSIRGDDLEEVGIGKCVDASTGAAELKAARRSSSSAGGGADRGAGIDAGLRVRPSKLSQN